MGPPNSLIPWNNIFGSKHKIELQNISNIILSQIALITGTIFSISVKASSKVLGRNSWELKIVILKQAQLQCNTMRSNFNCYLQHSLNTLLLICCLPGLSLTESMLFKYLDLFNCQFIQNCFNYFPHLLFGEFFPEGNNHQCWWSTCPKCRLHNSLSISS